MPLSEQAKQRDEALRDRSQGLGTLRSAVSNINIGEGIDGCQGPVATNREIGQSTIERMRQALDELNKLLLPPA